MLHSCWWKRWATQKRIDAKRNITFFTRKISVELWIILRISSFKIGTYYHTNSIYHEFVGIHTHRNKMGMNKVWFVLYHNSLCTWEFHYIELYSKATLHNRLWENLSLSVFKVFNALWLREKSLQKLLSVATHLTDRFLSKSYRSE